MSSYAATTYTVYPHCYNELPPSQRHLWVLYVVQHVDGWVIRVHDPHRGHYLNRQDLFVYERGKTYSFDQAIRRASRAVDTLALNGFTVDEAVRRYQARNAES